jgi:hypothetical protein
MYRAGCTTVPEGWRTSQGAWVRGAAAGDSSLDVPPWMYNSSERRAHPEGLDGGVLPLEVSHNRLDLAEGETARLEILAVEGHVGGVHQDHIGTVLVQPLHKLLEPVGFLLP